MKVLSSLKNVLCMELKLILCLQTVQLRRTQLLLAEQIKLIVGIYTPCLPSHLQYDLPYQPLEGEPPGQHLCGHLIPPNVF